jgi:hypothetical protein
MVQFDNPADLVALAKEIDLYGRRHRIMFALDVGEYDNALHLCQGALADCERNISCVSAPADNAGHQLNFTALREFANLIATAAHANVQAVA